MTSGSRNTIERRRREVSRKRMLVGMNEVEQAEARLSRAIAGDRGGRRRRLNIFVRNSFEKACSTVAR
jgi:hypothetical protein